MGFHHTSNWHVYAPDGRRKYLDAIERERFLDAASLEPMHVRALCIFLVFAGCRISEALELRSDMIDRATNAVVLRTMKRRKLAFRQIPLPEIVASMLSAIAPAHGRIWPVHRVTAWRWVSRVMERAAVDGPMACCRGTRHTFAMHAAACSVPLSLLQKWMGHASLSTTAIYLDAIGPDERGFAERMW